MGVSDVYWQSAEGLRLHARDYAAEGDARPRLPVICLHGLTRNARDFEDVAPWLAQQGRRVLAVDVRGRGLSQWDPAADYRLPAYADDVVRLMDAEGLTRAIFIGTSMGGLITMDVAGVRPDLMAGAVINDVGPVLAPAGLMRIASYVGRETPVATWDDAAAYARSLNAHALPHYTEADWRAMAARLFREDEAGRVVLDYDPDIAKPFADGPLMGDPWARWNALTQACPVLLLRGERSDLLTEELALGMLAGRIGVTLRTVPGVGHAPMLDEPESRAALEWFVRALP